MVCKFLLPAMRLHLLSANVLQPSPLFGSFFFFFTVSESWANNRLMKERQKEHEKWKKRLLKICIFSMQPSLGLWINGYIDSHFLLTVFQIGVILSFFLPTALCRHLHQHFIGCLGQGHFFLTLVHDFVTWPARLLDGTFFSSLGFLLEEFKNVIIFCHVLHINPVITWSIPGVKPFPCHVPHSPLSATPC